MADAKEAQREAELLEHLREIRRIAGLTKTLEQEREKHVTAAVPLLREVGILSMTDPLTGEPVLVNVRESETLQVDAGELYDALIEQEGGDIAAAEVIWKDVLKPPAVDTKDGGLFHQACTPADEDTPARIKPETIAKVANYKKSKAYPGFAKPGG